MPVSSNGQDFQNGAVDSEENTIASDSSFPKEALLKRMASDDIELPEAGSSRHTYSALQDQGDLARAVGYYLQSVNSSTHNQPYALVRLPSPAGP